MGHVTHDMWHLTRDTWHVTCDTWHMTRWGGWTFSQNFSSLALTVFFLMILWRYWGKGWLTDWLNEWMNELVTRLFIEQPRLHRVSLKTLRFTQEWGRLDNNEVLFIWSHSVTALYDGDLMGKLGCCIPRLCLFLPMFMCYLMDASLSSQSRNPGPQCASQTPHSWGLLNQKEVVRCAGNNTGCWAVQSIFA